MTRPSVTARGLSALDGVISEQEVRASRYFIQRDFGPREEAGACCDPGPYYPLLVRY